jgi:hypothetical protein
MALEKECLPQTEEKFYQEGVKEEERYYRHKVWQ